MPIGDKSILKAAFLTNKDEVIQDMQQQAQQQMQMQQQQAQQQEKKDNAEILRNIRKRVRTWRRKKTEWLRLKRN